MLTKSLLAFLAVAAINASLATAAVAAPVAPAPGLRLIKQSEDDAGTWMTEDEKFEKLIQKGIHFMDITETWGLEAMRLARVSSEKKGTPVVKRAVFPSAPSHTAEAKPLASQAVQSNLQTWSTSITNIYNRYYRGSYAASSSQWVYDTVVSAASGNSAITVTKFTHSYNQPSIIAKIPGKNANIVVVSAHFDSVNDSNTSGRAPGADDNASGVVVVLEALRVLANAKFAPTNTLEFHFYSGEEGGLLGSRAVFQSYKSSSKNVLAVMNQDMTGYSPNNVIAVYTDYVDSGLTAFIQKLVPVYTTLPLSTDRCGYACSDHGSARDAGYPAAYVCDENMADSSPYIHSANDALSTLNFPHMLQHAKLTIGFLVEASYF